MDSLELDKDGLPTAELNPETDWQRIFPVASPSKLLRQLQRENKHLGDGVVNLQFLQFTERERIVLKSKREDGWCIGYRMADESTKDLLGLMVSMPSGTTMRLKIWTAACALMTDTLTSLYQTCCDVSLASHSPQRTGCQNETSDFWQRGCDAVCTLADEGFAYCSFSFFPAMPWESVAVPASIPAALKPANFFQSG